MEITIIKINDFPRIKSVAVNNESLVNNQPAQIKIYDDLGYLICVLTAKREPEIAQDGTILQPVTKFEITQDYSGCVDMEIQKEFQPDS